MILPAWCSLSTPAGFGSVAKMANATVCKTVPTWFTGSIPVTPIESSAIHSLVFRFRLRKADGMVIPVLSAGMSWFDP